MNKRVYNKTFGKIVRTLGFLLILATSGYLATNLVLTYQTLPFIDKLVPFAEMADEYLNILPIIGEYAYLGLVAGFILILWAIRRGIILRVLLTVVLVFGFIESSINGTSPLIPITLASPSWLQGLLGAIEPLVDQITAISTYIVPGVAVAAPFLLWMLFAYKKPGRFSLLLLRLGSILLFLAVAILAVKTLFLPAMEDVELYGTIQTSLYILTYISFLVGSLFGTLGFARK